MIVHACPLCLSAEESVDHLLLNCAVSQDISNSLFYCFEYSWVLPSSIHGLFEVWKYEFGTPIGKLLWSASFFATIWAIWKERSLKSLMQIFAYCECIVVSL